MAGNVYVTVGGNASDNGIMLLNGSSTTGSINYRLNWDNGFTNQGWDIAFKNSSLCPLSVNWSYYWEKNYSESSKYGPDEAGFIAYLQGENPNNLNHLLDNGVLRPWTNDDKNAYIDLFGDLFTGQNTLANSGCLEKL